VDIQKGKEMNMNSSVGKLCAYLLIVFCVVPSVTPFVISSIINGPVNSTDTIAYAHERMNAFKNGFSNGTQTINFYDLHRLPEGYLEKSSHATSDETTVHRESKNEELTNPVTFNGGPMDSPWPMYSHDVHHTGLSPYSTADNPLTEKWRFSLSWPSDYDGFILDRNGIIYGGPDYVYGIYPNGTMKWAYPKYSVIESTPAIDENGILYVGTIWGMPNYLHAIYSNNGTQKWAYLVGNDIDSSPAIGADGTIYFGDWNGIVQAVNPDGTVKWKYHTGDVITSSPAIGDDGTIYIGSHDDNVYALYPNGTVKWQFRTGSWVHASPTIGPDGTIYIGSDDKCLYALNPDNGSMIWQCNVGSTWCSPTLGPDGILYLGDWEMNFYAVNPNGTIKWTYNAPGRIWFGSSAAVSSDGTIFFGTTTMDGGSGALVALNPDGTKRFQDNYGYYATTPAIGEDGTVYAPSFNEDGMCGTLHAFNKGVLRADAGGPYTAFAGERFIVNEGIYGGMPPYTCLWNFGDGNTSNEQHPTHFYYIAGVHTITFTVTDSEQNTSIDTTTINVTYRPPDIWWVKPNGGIFIANVMIFRTTDNYIFGPITIKVRVKQPVAGIDRVEFYIDGILRSTDYKAPYRWTWLTPYPLSDSRHTILMVAYLPDGTNADTWRTVFKLF